VTLAELQKKLAVFEAQKTAEVAAGARTGRASQLHEQSGPGQAAKSVQEDLEAGGLSRATLCSDEWHRSHPKAARHLFGFGTWRETSAWLLLLWDELQLLTQERGSGLSDAHVTPFEKCLLCEVRIHRACPLETLALTWGRATHCQFTLYENKIIFRDLQRLWMKRKPYRPPCRWKTLGLLFHFVIKILNKAGRRPRSELGRTGHFFTNPETWPCSPASPWRADKENARAPFSNLFF
jgi:hypothetical protein